MNFYFYSKYNGKSTIEQLRRVTFFVSSSSFHIVYILKHSIQFPYMSIRELADEIPTSTASIMRFVKKMGYDSFPELKYAYKKEEKEVSLHMVNDLDETIDCLKKFNTPYYQDLFK